MIRITPAITIEENEISETFIRASGPGGQNVNKLSTAVELRFDAANSPSIDAATYIRLKNVAGRKLARTGVLTIRAQTHRTQERNRAEALARLVDLLRKAAVVPRHRWATKLPKYAKQRRRQAKTRHSTIKKLRHTKPSLD